MTDSITANLSIDGNVRVTLLRDKGTAGINADISPSCASPRNGCWLRSTMETQWCWQAAPFPPTAVAR